jgi:hypothetical protein
MKHPWPLLAIHRILNDAIVVEVPLDVLRVVIAPFGSLPEVLDDPLLDVRALCLFQISQRRRIHYYVLAARLLL